MLFSAILYVLDIYMALMMFVCTCFCWHSHWLLILSSSMLNRTQSHMCVRLYLPMFLIRVRLIILIKIDSLIVLAKCCPLLHSMLKLFSMVMWPVLDWWPYISEGAFSYSLNLPPIVLGDSLMYSSSQSSLLYLYNNKCTQHH